MQMKILLWIKSEITEDMFAYTYYSCNSMGQGRWFRLNQELKLDWDVRWDDIFIF